ncbi:M14 family zinc carboxypeptidase [Kitasatospora sp. NBC_01287]|uniref:M14 family zinc carboxypeptidase n=1 Tax=Kitasatospora sp. NBC_01287 TaxID=2903573 RepID=UPI002254DF63|nr:M14 family zinc carboxypeptidase [Kitasatospora sp. NBC_01287]MCX4749007.1 M14 family zinc carboxypeptidase [Kitasatospora sp. NBC_01287]
MYLTVDQLIDRAATLARRSGGTLRRIGESAQGRPLWLLSLGAGERHVLVVAGAHANEPVGMTTSWLLARQAAAQPGGFSWHFVLCLDPDGAARNEEWLRGPLTMERHFQHFYRPPAAGQPEWLGAERLPETRALLGVIEELRPALQCSLHGVDFGGAFVQLTRPIAGFSRPFGSADQVPLELGSADAAYWPSPEPGLYLMPGAGARERFEVLPEDAAASTWTHLGVTTAVVEVPMWAVTGVGDDSPHPDPAAALQAAARRLRDRLRGVRAYGHPAAEETLALAPGLADEWERGTWARTVAQVTSLELAAERIPLRVAAALGSIPRIAGHCADLRERFAPRWVPVTQQARLQARAVAAGARAVLGDA